MLVAVLRDMAHVGAALVNGGAGNILPAQGNAAGGLVQSGQAVDQLRLAVAVDTGDADDLTGADVKADMVHGVALMGVGCHAQILYPQDLLAGPGRVFHHLQLHGAAHHHVGKLLLVGIAGVDSADIAALAQHGDPVGDLHDLVELVGDEQNGLSLRRQILHDLHQFLDLLRRQNGGRLIEDQDLVVAVEHLQDLHTLLHAHGDVLHLGVHIHLQAIVPGELLHLLAGLFLPDKAQLGVLGAQNDVVHHGKYVYQLEMLMDHADPQRRRCVGVGDRHLLAVFADLSGFRLIQAKENAHQRGFSRAVFAQQRVDLTFLQLERNVVIGLDARKLLGDVKHFDHILGSIVHAATCFL